MRKKILISGILILVAGQYLLFLLNYHSKDSAVESILLNNLALFFNLKNSFVLAWTLPFFVLLTFRRFDSVEFVFFMVFLSIALLVAIRGAFNFRYSLTILPICIFAFFYLVNKNLPASPSIIFIVSFIPLLFLYFQMVYTVQPDSFNKWLSFRLNIQRYSYSRSFYPHDIYLALQQPPYSSQVFLVNNLPGFYYYTPCKGYYYWAPNDRYFTNHGYENLFENRTDMEVYSVLTNKLNCKYIFTLHSYNKLNTRFESFLNKYCTLVLTSRYGDYEVYGITGYRVIGENHK